MTAPAVELVNVVADLGQGPVLDDITLEIPSAVAFGVLGPPRAGKTALARVVRGEIIPRSGRVRINGRRPSPWTSDFHRQLGIVEPVGAALAGFSVEDLLGRSLRSLGFARIDCIASARFLLRRFDLWSERGTPYARLASPVRCRFETAYAFVGRPAVVMLDEPGRDLTLGDATALRDTTIALARECQSALLVLSSDPAVIEAWCESAAVMMRGRIVARDVIDPRATHRGQWLEIVACENPRRLVERAMAHPRVLDVWEDERRILLAFEGRAEDLARNLGDAGAAIVEARPIASPLREAYETILAGSDILRH